MPCRVPGTKCCRSLWKRVPCPWSRESRFPFFPAPPSSSPSFPAVPCGPCLNLWSLDQPRLQQSWLPWSLISPVSVGLSRLGLTPALQRQQGCPASPSSSLGPRSLNRNQ